MVSLVSGVTGFMLFSYAPPLATVLYTISSIYAVRAFIWSVGGMWLKKTGKYKIKIDTGWPALRITCALSGVLAVWGLVFLFLIVSGIR